MARREISALQNQKIFFHELPYFLNSIGELENLLMALDNWKAHFHLFVALS